MSLRHTWILAQTPLDDPVHIFIPPQFNIGFHAMHPFVVWECLGSFAVVRISVQVRGPAFLIASLILSRNSSYVSIEAALRGVFQYGLWHFGQTLGSLSPFGTHS